MKKTALFSGMNAASNLDVLSNWCSFCVTLSRLLQLICLVILDETGQNKLQNAILINIELLKSKIFQLQELQQQPLQPTCCLAFEESLDFKTPASMAAVNCRCKFRLQLPYQPVELRVEAFRNTRETSPVSLA